MQEQFIFYPDHLPPDYKYDLSNNDREVFIDTPDDQKINGILFKSGEKEHPKVILYFHGNAGSLSSWQYIWDDLKGLGHDLLIIDYRGYGKSTGKITEQGLYNDAIGSYDHLIKEGYKASDIIVYGRSIGSAPGIQLCNDKEVGALVLESPFTTMADLASSIFPFPIPELILQFKFKNISKLGEVKVPVLILHGDADEIVPFKQGEKIFETLEGEKTMVSIKGGGHNNLSAFPEYGDGLREFLGNLNR